MTVRTQSVLLGLICLALSACAAMSPSPTYQTVFRENIFSDRLVEVCAALGISEANAAHLEYEEGMNATWPLMTVRFISCEKELSSGAYRFVGRIDICDPKEEAAHVRRWGLPPTLRARLKCSEELTPHTTVSPEWNSLYVMDTLCEAHGGEFDSLTRNRAGEVVKVTCSRRTRGEVGGEVISYATLYTCDRNENGVRLREAFMRDSAYRFDCSRAETDPDLLKLYALRECAAAHSLDLTSCDGDPTLTELK